METSNISFSIKGRWDGNRNGSGTMITNGVQIPVSAPASLDGPGIGSNPEELLLASAATCYILTLAAILSKREIGYSHLEINSEAIVQEEGNTLTYKEIIHRPVIVLNDGDDEKKGMVEQLAQRAEKACFIGKTLKPGVAISVQPVVLNYNDFQWTFKTQYEMTEDGINIFAPAGTDYFVNPADGIAKTDAPFYYKEVEGDFVLRAKVSHDFISIYDACVLLALDHDKLWAKACFEYTDLGTNSVVTVMTNGRSDDANGINVDGNEIWLQMSRKDNIFAVHYSYDGKEYMMARICYLPMSRKIKVGLEAQSPTGDGGIRRFTDVSLELRSPADIRKGN